LKQPQAALSRRGRRLLTLGAGCAKEIRNPLDREQGPVDWPLNKKPEKNGQRGALMNIDIKAVHFTLKDDVKDYLNRKIATRLPNVENMIVDLLFTLTKDKDFTAEATVNFRWGVSVHVKDNDFELNPAVDKLIDKLDAKIIKEKEKLSERR
jgi:putative sigma-54 modulation protein